MPHRSQLPYVVLALLIAAACSPVLRTPMDFPEPRLTPIIELPTAPPPAPTPRPLTKPIFRDDMAGARTLLLILKVGMMAGDSTSVAERVYYPIQVRVNGQPATIHTAAEFERDYEAIFSDPLKEIIIGADEGALELRMDGVIAAGGALWFNQFCADAACTRGEFLITHINN